MKNLQQMDTTILVVDDQVDLLELVVDDLTPYYKKIVTAKNGKEALEKLAQESVDLVLTDYLMPVMNGLELIKNCHDKYPHLPIIMLTGNATDPKILEIIKNGSFDILEKPYISQILINRVQLGLLVHGMITIFWTKLPEKTDGMGLRQFFQLPLSEKYSHIKKMNP